ncbi:uncharacterized protein LOC124650409 [Lolium rigidum]|uniref:uncharacterized protein LOC124650409 n=1 Tax=Lolium rigidum TaxID=89674 RepID=UPI001F5CAAF8|nr:uncharacterized protein LOC124650409 [Lolium rigidum]
MPYGTDTPASSPGTDHPAEKIIVGRKKRTGQGWYASLSEDKKEEYRKKQRQDRLHKKSEAHIVNMDLPQSSTIDHVSPVASYSPTISMSDEHNSQNGNAEQKKTVGEGWYARLSEHKKEEYLHKLRMTRLQKKTSTLGVNKDEPQPSNSQTLLGFMHVGTTQSIGTAQPDLSQVVDTPCTVPTRYDQNAIDWMHNNPTYQRRALVGKDICNKELTPTDMLEQESLKPTSYVSGRSLQMIDASSCKKRQRMRGQYAMMTPEQKDGVLHRNRAYKMVKRHTLSLHQQSGIAYVPAGSAYTSPSNPAIHVQPSRAHNPTGDRNSDGESDPACISEPFEQCGRFEDNVDTMQEEEETMHDDDEESRIFSGLGDVFDSYRVTTDVPQSQQNDDPFDFVYHNLPQKHHVLKP